MVNAAGVPQIGTASTNPAVTVDPKTGQVRPFMFRMSYTDPYQGKVMADYLINKLGVKSAAVITDVGSDYSEGLKEFFTARLAELKGDLKGVWGFRGGDVDFRAQLTEMKATGAEAVALPILYKEMGLIMKQAAELDWKPIFIGGDGFSPSMHEIAGDAMEGSYWVYSMDLGNPQMIYLLSRFEKEYGVPAAEPGNVAYAGRRRDQEGWESRPRGGQGCHGKHERPPSRPFHPHGGQGDPQPAEQARRYDALEE
ncbi:MAG: branched-chain amino acid transport system substrate-binding protein [Synergistaceae bacterium]|nr:branched-chain amino acid transport system substrate-binding protein [Synergistaceae bacterium]